MTFLAAYHQRLLSVCLWTCLGVSAAGQSWPSEQVVGPFHFHANFPLATDEPLLQSITQLRHEVPQTLGLGEVEESIHVFLFGSRTVYRNYMHRYFPDVPSRQALYIKRRGPGMVFAYRGHEFEVDLRHETTHAVLHSLLPMVPLWLDEGLGEYFEVPAVQRASGHPHLRAIRNQVRWQRVANIRRLESCYELSEMQADHYRDSWAWVHFMLHGPPAAKAVLLAYLQDIAAHVPPGQLSDRLRLRVPKLEQQYLLHFRQWRP